MRPRFRRDRRMTDAASPRGGRFSIGPGALVAAAFIGPGTVTTCILAGARYRYALLWALLFATAATIVLQEMAARIGTIAGLGLGEAMRRRLRSPGARAGTMLLVAAAIGVGNAAYETGNLLGAALGGELLLGGSHAAWAVALAAVAGVLLWTGSYRIIERVLVGMVVVMSLLFLATAVAVGPAWPEVLRGTFLVSLPAKSGVLALALVGTTVVPYNLFLHAATAKERFFGRATLRDARIDLGLAIGLGGVVSAGILVTAAAGGGPIESAVEMAQQLRPLLGPWATGFFALGLLAAGMTSAITAPLAAAYAITGTFGWPGALGATRARIIWGTVLATGTGFAVSGVHPVPAILFAQAANGLLLPLIAGALLLVANDRDLLGNAVNGRIANTGGGLVVLLAILLGVRGLMAALGIG